MKLTHSLRNFLFNAIRLVRLLLSNKYVHWQFLSNTSENSKVHKYAKLWDCYHIADTIVEKGTYIGPNAVISNTTIGRFCSIGPNFCCGWGIHPLHGISTSPVFYSTKMQVGFSYSKEDKIIETKRIFIGNDVFIGRNVTILDGITIGDGAVIGAGAVVSKDIPPYAVAVGSPIKIIKYRFSQDIIHSLTEIKWWEKDEEVLIQVEKNFFDVENFILNNKQSPDLPSQNL
ncbi:CatB-related O-acetyltransferase [Flavisolibacter sp. BT320]|nr:CatB-related O-acetyltransferase [Flavisolibacter longurius]